MKLCELTLNIHICIFALIQILRGYSYLAVNLIFYFNFPIHPKIDAFILFQFD